MSGQVCRCGKGHVSAYDGKCGHCRTRREQKTHEYKLQQNLYDPIGWKLSQGVGLDNQP